MNIRVSDYFTANTYIKLIPFTTPRYFLIASNKDALQHSLKLFRPFSQKGRILKKIIHELTFIKYMLGQNYQEGRKVKDLKYLLEINALPYNQISTSVYIATDKNKIVVQIQTQDEGVVAYFKLSTNKRGNSRLNNEILACHLLKDEQIKSLNLIDSGELDGHLWFLSSPLQMDFSQVSEQRIYLLLDLLKKKNTQYLLREHPRLIQIASLLKKQREVWALEKLNDLIQNSNDHYCVVKEHGDFAPWNIASYNKELYLFDLEFFEEDGLEFFDLIYYWFSQEVFLKQSRGDSLIRNVLNKIDSPEKVLFFQLFLIKEIAFRKNFGFCIKKLLKKITN